MLLFALLACAPATPDSWTLSAPGVVVEVGRDSFSLTFADEDGRALLSTLDDADGYANMAYAEGTVSWDPIVTQGYTELTTRLGAWTAGWVVRTAAPVGDALVLDLALPADVDERGHLAPEAVQLHVAVSVRAGAARVEAWADGADPRAWSVGFPSDADERFIGFGERFNRTDQRGVSVYSWAEEGGIGTGEGDLAGPDNPFPNGEAMTYYPVPFFVSTEGYGFWLDSTWYNAFELATERDDAWRVWHLGPKLAFEVYLPTPDDDRPWPLQLIDRFTAATGRPMVPPAWTFGPRRRIGRNDKQILPSGEEVSEIQAHRALDLALTAVDDAVHFLPAGSDVGREAELAAWTASAAALGLRVNGYYNAYLEDEDDNPLQDELQRGKDNGWFLRDADGELSRVWLISGDPVWVVTVDFTSEDATAWYQSMLDRALDLGYSGWMYDFGEYVQADVVTASGLSGEQYHNQFPVDYQRAAFEHLEQTDRAGDWLTFARSGYTGSSQYTPMVWSGDPAASFEDSDGLPSMVRAGVNLGVSGSPFWGGDINGFHCFSDGYAAADEELLIRWIQQGALTPNMQDQDACSAAPDDGRKANIFDDLGAQAAWATYARLHTRLFPYLYALALEAHETGAPLMRSLFLEHPDDADLAAVDDAYYLGPALLVAPVVVRGETQKAVPLPPGRYLDWRDGSVIEGGQEVTLDAPLDELPLLLRDGHLLPLLDGSIDTLSEEDDPDIVGLGDVAGVLDVVGLLSAEVGAAAWEGADGEALAVRWEGALAPPELDEVADEAALADCDGCYLWEEDDQGAVRLRVSASGDVSAGGLSLSAQGLDRARWDLVLVP